MRVSVFRVGLGVGGAAVGSGSRARPSHSCDGWVCDLGGVGALLIFGLVRGDEGGSGAQKRGPSPSPPDTVGTNKKASTPRTSDRNHQTKTTNLNLAQGKIVDTLRTTTSYFDKDGSIQWIPEQIVGIGEDFHNQVDDGKVKTTLYKVRWRGYDRTGDTWEPITHLQGYGSMVKAFKESHEKDVERLAADRRREAESKEAHALKNAPKHTVVFMKGLTSPVWTLGMFQMVTGDSCQYMNEPNRVRLAILQFGMQYAQFQDGICGQISEHFQSGESLYHNWN